MLVPHHRPRCSVCRLTLQVDAELDPELESLCRSGPSSALLKSVLFTSKTGEKSVNSTCVSAVTGIQASGISDRAFPHPQALTASAGFSLSSACLRQTAWQVRPGAVLSCLLGQGLASRPGQEAGAPPSPGKMGSFIPTGHLGILPCWRNWFPGPDALLHLLAGSWLLGALSILSVFLGVVDSFLLAKVPVICASPGLSQS